MIQRISLTLPRWSVNNNVLLNVRINEYLLIRMLLDTGAKYCAISGEIAQQLAIDISDVQQVSVSTASGLERTPLIKLNTVDISGFVHRDIDAAVMSLPTAIGVDGLLGMSFIRRCRMVLDVPSRSLEFESDE